VQCEFRENSGEVPICPRTVLRKIVEKARSNGRDFLVGFEIEVVFMTTSTTVGKTRYGEIPVSEGHAWSTSRALHNNDILATVEAIIDALENSGIVVQQFHPESSPGQYEFITGPLPPLQAADALIAAREIVSATAANCLPGRPLRATFTPRPYPNAAGTGAHIHISMTPETDYRMFYAGVLKYLRAIVAITYPNALSYDRVRDGIWAGGTWVAWGTQNRETPLRKISGSHWEFKCADGFANTYLALAAILGAGLQGILDKQELVIKDCAPDPSTLTNDGRRELGIMEELPRSIAQALEGVDALRDVLGREVIGCYRAVKWAEWRMLEEMDDKQRRGWLIERY
jgi:glutamine synthetase